MADLAGAYADARRRLGELLAGLDEAALATPVPACPAWTVRDVLADVTGVAADAAGGTYFAGAADAWSDVGLAAAREEWTAGQVRTRRQRPVGPWSPSGPAGGDPGADARRGRPAARVACVAALCARGRPGRPPPRRARRPRPPR